MLKLDMLRPDNCNFDANRDLVRVYDLEGTMIMVLPPHPTIAQAAIIQAYNAGYNAGARHSRLMMENEHRKNVNTTKVTA